MTAKSVFLLAPVLSEQAFWTGCASATNQPSECHARSLASCVSKDVLEEEAGCTIMHVVPIFTITRNDTNNKPEKMIMASIGWQQWSSSAQPNPTQAHSLAGVIKKASRLNHTVISETSGGAMALFCDPLAESTCSQLQLVKDRADWLGNISECIRYE